MYFEGCDHSAQLVLSTRAKEVIKNLCPRKNDLCLASLIPLPPSYINPHTRTDTHGLVVLLMLAHLCSGTSTASLALITALSFSCKHQPTSP